MNDKPLCNLNQQTRNKSITKSLPRSNLRQGKGDINVQANLNHLSVDSAIRRPSGLTDNEWDWLITETVRAVHSSPQKTSVMTEMVRILLDDKTCKHGKPFQAILKALGVDPKKDIMFQNWEHTAFRFYRHFAPEDYRNAISHSGLGFAFLKFRDGQFVWISKQEFVVAVETKVLSMVDAKAGDRISIVASGFTDVETVVIKNGSATFEYYEKGRSKAFGDTMYLLKQAILKNKVEALRSTIQKAER